MPGANCSIFGCTSSRYSKHITIFGLPKGNDEYNTTWRKKLINIITKDRVVDMSLKKQIENNSLHICERHFQEDDMNQSKYFIFVLLLFIYIVDN